MMQKISAEIAEPLADSTIQHDVLTFSNLTVGQLRHRSEKAPCVALIAIRGGFMSEHFASLGRSLWRCWSFAMSLHSRGRLIWVGCVSMILFGVFWCSFAQALAQPAYKLGKKTHSLDDLRIQDKASWYELEKQIYALVESAAHQAYLDHYWDTIAKEQKITPEVARRNFFDQHAKVSPEEFRQVMAEFGEHPQLSRFSASERESQIRTYLEQNKMEAAINEIISTAISRGELQILYPKPQEPVFMIPLHKGDLVRYGPNSSDVAPMGCAGDDCPITVIEYSEFQCAFCARVLPIARRLLTEYQGRVRWVVRDWPMPINDRARPAAIAAHCAGQQEKYWDMYFKLFDNQTALQDQDFRRYASQINGVDLEQWSDCVANAADVRDQIERNFSSGRHFGVTSAPSFFVNGRRVFGALPFEEFKRIFDEELAKNRGM